MQLWPRERADQEVLRLEKGGGSLGGGLFSGGGPIVSLKEAGTVFVRSCRRLMRC